MHPEHVKRRLDCHCQVEWQQRTTSMVWMLCCDRASMCDASWRRARMPPCTAGCSVFTRPACHRGNDCASSFLCMSSFRGQAHELQGCTRTMQHLREICNILHVGHADPSGLYGLGAAACGDELIAQVAQALHECPLVVDTFVSGMPCVCMHVMCHMWHTCAPWRGPPSQTYPTQISAPASVHLRVLCEIMQKSARSTWWCAHIPAWHMKDLPRCTALLAQVLAKGLHTMLVQCHSILVGDSKPHAPALDHLSSPGAGMAEGHCQPWPPLSNLACELCWQHPILPRHGTAVRNAISMPALEAAGLPPSAANTMLCLSRSADCHPERVHRGAAGSLQESDCRGAPVQWLSNPWRCVQVRVPQAWQPCRRVCCVTLQSSTATLPLGLR